jgi:RNA polymerase-binding transcription factor DksA
MRRNIRTAYRGKLEALRNRLTRETLEIARCHGTCGSPGDRADLSLDNSTEEIDMALLGNEELLLEAVNGALERLTTRDFGRCESCHSDISSRRLRSTPYTRFCVKCAGSEE